MEATLRVRRCCGHSSGRRLEQMLVTVAPVALVVASKCNEITYVAP